MRQYKGIVVAALVLVMLMFMTLFLGARLKAKIEAGNEKVQVLDQKSKEETKRAKEISELKERMKSDDYKEQVAKDQLGLVRDGEIIFKKSDKKDKPAGDAGNPIEPEEIEHEDADSGAGADGGMSDPEDTGADTDNN
uniref:FtsB family cell division protein n=1 Tax=Eubacterium cellulosolvens TaxID=29322 RepID=UPI000687C5CB|nr:septum formation initiator family protein [[Eubacterium] cellulosolvens]